MLEKFKINGKVVVITGGAGLMGMQHAEAIAEIGGIPVLFDIDEERIKEKVSEIKRKYNVSCIYHHRRRYNQIKNTLNGNVWSYRYIDQ